MAPRGEEGGRNHKRRCFSCVRRSGGVSGPSGTHWPHVCIKSPQEEPASSHRRIVAPPTHTAGCVCVCGCAHIYTLTLTCTLVMLVSSCLSLFLRAGHAIWRSGRLSRTVSLIRNNDLCADRRLLFPHRRAFKSSNGTTLWCIHSHPRRSAHPKCGKTLNGKQRMSP